MNLSDNPIFQRFLSQAATPERSYRPLIWLNGLAFIALFFFIGYQNSPSFNLIILLTCPPALIMLGLIASTTATLAIRESSSDAYQLLFLTNLSRTKLIWGLFAGIFYRLRFYILITAWLLLICLLPLFISSRHLAHYTVDNEPLPLSEAFAMFLLSLIVLAGLILLTLASTFSTALRSQRPLYAVATTVFSLLILGYLGFSLTFFIMVEIRHLSSFGIGFILFTIPHLLAYLLSRRWQSSFFSTLSLTVFLVPIFLFLMGILRLFNLTFLLSSLFMGLNIFIAFLLILVALMNWGKTSASIAITALAWQALYIGLTILYEKTGSRLWLEFFASVFLYNVIFSPLSIGLNTLYQAKRWAWRFNF